jgi:hypothetical protein
MTAALTVGDEIVRLRRIARRFAMDAVLEPAMTAIAAGDSSTAVRELERFDRALAKLPNPQLGRGRFRARAARFSPCPNR